MDGPSMALDISRLIVCPSDSLPNGFSPRITRMLKRAAIEMSASSVDWRTLGTW